MCMVYNMHVDFFFKQHTRDKQIFSRILTLKKCEGKEQGEIAVAIE